LCKLVRGVYSAKYDALAQTRKLSDEIKADLTVASQMTNEAQRLGAGIAIIEGFDIVERVG
jgi:hypothetical protein